MFGRASVVVLFALLTALPSAQAAQFDAISIRKSASMSRRPDPTDPNRFYRSQVTLLSLVQYAYELSVPHIWDGPDWMRSMTWQVDARARAIESDSQRRQMVKQLLIERFGLRAHMERRTVEGVVLSTSSRTVPGLRPTDAKCSGQACDPPTYELRRGRTTWRRHAVHMSGIVWDLELLLDRVIIDETRQSGVFDVELLLPPTWSPDVDPDLPSLLEAIRTQLGLDGKVRELSADILIVDRATLPIEN